MIQQQHKAIPPTAPTPRPWLKTRAERGGPDDLHADCLDDAPRIAIGIRLLLGFACLGSALISTTALVLVIRWITPP